MDATPDPVRAQSDLDFVKEVLRRTERRIDPHAFHFVHWGLIVLVWYPAGTYLHAIGEDDVFVWVSAAAITLGFLLSTVREMRLKRRERVPGENTYVGNQVGWVTFASIAAGVALSVVGPVTRFYDGWRTPIVWGVVYANLAFMVGVVYRKEWRWSGLAIFVATLVAMALPDVQGYVLGPAMGLGIAVPGFLAEARVKRLAKEALGG